MVYQNSLNCYKKCSNYYFFDENRNYFCANNSFCPKDYNKLIIDKKECIKNCSLDDNNKYEFRNTCYNKCPMNTEISAKNEFFCEIICDENNPFELIEEQKCVDFCDFELILLELCV